MTKICPEVQLHGVCHTPGCTKHHEVHLCEMCAVVCYSLSVYNAHLAGKKHRGRDAGTGAMVHCTICDMHMLGSKAWEAHVKGKKHVRLSKAQASGGGGTIVEPSIPDAIPGQTYCSICSKFIDDHRWAYHLTSREHHNKEKYTALRAVLDEARKDKHGVTVTNDLDFGIVEPTSADVNIEKQFSLSTTIPASRVSVIGVTLTSSASRRQLHTPFSVTRAPLGQPLLHGKRATVTISFSTAYSGRAEDQLEIIFEDKSLDQRFVIIRSLRGIVGSSADYELLKPKAPYRPQPRTSKREETDVIPGIRAPSLNAIPYIGKLPQAKASASLVAALSEPRSVRQTIDQIRRVFLPLSLDSSTYGRFFKTLVWAEEFQSEHDLERYDVPNATLAHYNSNYRLEVPGLAEKRPSVLVGDRILVHKHGAPEGQWFEGYVHFVFNLEVSLHFHRSFKGWSPEQRYHIRFKLNRIPVQRQHQALDTAFSPERILFPRPEHIKPANINAAAVIQTFNPLIAQNPAQLLAVKSIVRLPSGSPPFILFGPPGTGKTVTIIEAIKQILKLNPNARILATAPSNSAADLIASRLVSSLKPDELFRLYAPSRHSGQVPDELRDHTCRNIENHFTTPTMELFKRFKVVVCTCVSASIPYGIGVPRGHFDYIFVDEAGQATEPEVMIGIKTMTDNDTNIVLSGDPLQLGPIIRSPVARELGLEKSFMERLIGTETYDQVVRHGRTIVKLVQNFRSHPAILDFPNERFYGQELQACGDKKVTYAYVGYSQLPSEKFPVIFHAVQGKDDREASSPSFFNIDEVTIVKKYIQKLRDDRKIRISDGDIGVITPYHAQCLRIRKALLNIADSVKVGSVEEFQGQERRVIIISTVRSSEDFVEYDLRHTLGFVANPRRLNVAITRAQALLIVIGDPRVLSLDPLWRSFLSYVYQNKGWAGPGPTWAADALCEETDVRVANAIADMNALSERITQLLLSETGASDEATVDNAEVAYANTDRPWRELE